jgi:hypothetical protein
LVEVVHGLAFDLVRHVAQGDARRGDASGESTLEQDKGLINEVGNGVEAGDNISGLAVHGK